MGFFNRSKKELATSSPQKCEHKFQDFPWILEQNKKTGNWQYENRLSYKIIEPYVCIYCGKREDIILEQKEFSGYSIKDMHDIIQQIQKQYADRIKPRAIIEDMIHDLKLVDPRYLQYYHMIQGTKDPSTSRQVNSNKDIDLKI